MHAREVADFGIPMVCTWDLGLVLPLALAEFEARISRLQVDSRVLESIATLEWRRWETE